MSENRLPSQPTSFVGREAELAQIADLLANPACRLLTLTGPGGIGKTRLAIEAARRCTSFNGVYFVPLQPLTSSDFMVSAIADSLKFSFSGDQNPKLQLLDNLHGKHLLLLLDNFEHLINGADLLPEILDAAPKVKILVTSREWLHLREEWVRNISGLPFPVQHTSDSLTDFGAVQLFIQSAVRAGYTPLDHDMVSIMHICRMVEGIPLAIELAAAWVRVMSCAEIARELEQGLDILTTTMRNFPEKHRSMRAAFAHSWNLLSEGEKIVFEKMSVFRGGFTRDAAEQVAGASLNDLSQLVDKSLLRVIVGGRYDLHELLRQYGEAQLAESGEADATKDAHSAYFTTFMAERWQDLKGRRFLPGLKDIEQDFDNVRTAWMYMVKMCKADEIHQSASALWAFCDLIDNKHEPIELFGRAIECLRRIQDEAHQRTLGHLLTRQDYFSVTLGTSESHRRGKDTIEEGLAILRRVGSSEEIVMALAALSFTHIYFGEFTEAVRLGREGVQIARETNDVWMIGFALNWLGNTYVKQWNRAEAKPILQESLFYSSQAGDLWSIAFSCGLLGLTALSEDKFEDARRLSLQSLKIYEAINKPLGISNRATQLMQIALSLGNIGEAKQYMLRSLKAAYDCGIVPDILMRVLDATDIFVALGQKERTLEILSMIMLHPMTHSRHRTVTREMLAALEAELSPEIYLAAVERGKLLRLEDVVVDLQATFSSETPRSDAAPLSTTPDSLTEREQEILNLLANGLNSREIAQQLYLSVTTIRWYVRQLYNKLGAHNRTQAISRARELKLVV